MIARYSPLIYWATERESIRLKKLEGLPPPWTTDPILQKYRFCNVQRKDDRVSQWLREHVLCNNDWYDQHVFIKLVALCRWVNWPPTLMNILGSDKYLTPSRIDLVGIGKFLDSNVKNGVKSWTGAYMVRAPSKRKFPGFTKGQFVSEVVVGAVDRFRCPLHGAISINHSRAVWEVLLSIPNWGSFMAGQVVADLTYTPLLSAAYDLNSWAPQGPGSTRGFNRLLGRPLKTKIEETEWLAHLQAWREQVVRATGLNLNLMDLQNCLCEVDKYLRVKYGEGRPRSTYKPETAY